LRPTADNGTPGRGTPARPRRRARGLRSRITLAATGGVALFLIAGAAVFLLLVRGALTDGLRATAERDAAALSQRIDAGGISALAADDADEDEAFYQVVSESGQVVAASGAVAGMSAIADSSVDDTFTLRIAQLDDEFVVATEEVDGNDDLTVVVGVTTEDVSDTLADVTPLVAGAVPVLLLLVATTTWITAGRALRPVERMRREVDAVTAQRLDRRLDTSGPADEVGRLAVTMNSMLDRLDESQRAQRRFISDASHELKSPLASIRQYAEVAKLHPDRVTQTELTDAVLDEGSRLEKIVHSMLLLAHADEHDLGHTPVAVDLDDILFAEAARLRASTAITVDASGIGAARTSGDAELLGQVVRNLADNAATHAAGLVALALVEGADVVITIDDDGPGIPAGDRDRVFERFVRLDDARARDAGGSGLGLAIVREIVASHGGTVHLSGSPLGGLRVEVRLPRDAS
jgi:signal transduction histidine kinase